MSKYSKEVVENFIELINIVNRNPEESGITTEELYSIIENICPDIEIEIAETFLYYDGLVEVTIEKDEKYGSTIENVYFVKNLRDFSPSLTVKQCIDIFEIVNDCGEYTFPDRYTILSKKCFSYKMQNSGFIIK